MAELTLPCLEVTQGSSRIYQFAIDGKLVPSFAEITRIRRGEQGDLFGYQRPEVMKHIQQIQAYVESAGAMVPNSIVLALSSKVTFRPWVNTSPLPYVRFGHLFVPVAEGEHGPREGFVVDGQQRLAAVRRAQLESFPLCAVAFITDDVATQQDQFLLVNSAKPLSKSLIYELLPGTKAQLPIVLQRKRKAAELLALLNGRPSSPLRGRVQTTTCPGGLIKDASMLKMLENSLSEGALYELADQAAQLQLLEAFWGAVERTFPEAWTLPPKKSRLTHGVGVVSMGAMMDAIAAQDARGTQGTFEKGLALIKPLCRWTDGEWSFSGGRVRRWNEVQNTGADIELVSQHLVSTYLRLAKKGRIR